MTYIIYIDDDDDLNDENLNKIQKLDDDLIFLDWFECDRLQPYVNGGKIGILSTILLTDFGNRKIYYSTPDINIHSQYIKLKKCLIEKFSYDIIKNEIEFVILPLFTFRYFNNLVLDNNHFKFDDNIIKIKNNDKYVDYFHTFKKYHFSVNVSESKIWRLYLLDKIYKNQNISYSHFPFGSIEHHTDYFSLLNNEIENNISDVDILSTSNRRLFFDNGFSNVDFKKLTEFSLLYYDIDHYITPENSIDIINKYTNYLWKTLQESVPLEYLQSYFIITVESYANNGILYTEKTWKAYEINKPNLIIGAKNQNKYLEMMGLQLYDDLFDYSFDSLDTILKRIDELSYQINELTKIPIKEFSKKIFEFEEITKYNIKLLHKMRTLYEPPKIFDFITEATPEILDYFFKTLKPFQLMFGENLDEI